MSPVRFGIIACSSVARRRFLPALAASKRAQLVHIGSRDPAKAGEWAREFSAAKSGDYDAVLADPEVEAVYISTPPSLHEEWVRKAVAKGKHVLCEKPAFGDFPTAVAVVDRCRAAGVCLAEGYAFRWHPQHAVVRSLIEQGRIGQARFFSAEFTYPRPPEGDIRLNPKLDGGVFRDSAGYPVAAALLQMPGRPVSVFCQLGQDPVSGVDDTFSLGLRFASGATAQMLVAFGAHYRSRYAITGTQGRVEVERAFSVGPQMKTAIALETDAATERIEVAPDDQFRLMVDDFSAQIRNAGSGRREFELDILRQHEVMDAAARSHREGRVIALSDYQL
jgi:dTDP-3,4-didehydro-2,6-dideoxy-alpha-D-glucose 3-reductase